MIHDLQQIHVPVILKSPLPPRQKNKSKLKWEQPNKPGGTSASLPRHSGSFPRGGAISPPPPGLRAMGPWGLEETGG